MASGAAVPQRQRVAQDGAELQGRNSHSKTLNAGVRSREG
jgi:hypothetical protein